MLHYALSGRTGIDWVNDVSVVNARLAAAPSASNYELVGSAISGPFALRVGSASNMIPLYRFVLLQARLVIASLKLCGICRLASVPIGVCLCGFFVARRGKVTATGAHLLAKDVNELTGPFALDDTDGVTGGILGYMRADAAGGQFTVGLKRCLGTYHYHVLSPASCAPADTDQGVLGYVAV
jgi:hypothetical protein